MRKDLKRLSEKECYWNLEVGDPRGLPKIPKLAPAWDLVTYSFGSFTLLTPSHLPTNQRCS